MAAPASVAAAPASSAPPPPAAVPPGGGLPTLASGAPGASRRLRAGAAGSGGRRESGREVGRGGRLLAAAAARCLAHCRAHLLRSPKHEPAAARSSSSSIHGVQRWPILLAGGRAAGGSSGTRAHLRFARCSTHSDTVPNTGESNGGCKAGWCRRAARGAARRRRFLPGAESNLHAGSSKPHAQLTLRACSAGSGEPS